MSVKTTCLVALALIVGACGSGGGGGGTGPELFLSAPNVPSMSGWGRGPLATPSVWPSTSGQLIWVGDSFTNTPEYGFYRFNIAGLPPGAQIVEAVFHTSQGNPVGGPFTTLGGQVVVDHLDLGNTFDATDYGTPSMIALDVAVLSTGPVPAGQRSANITSAVQADVNAGRTRTDIRLRFPIGTNGNNNDDDLAYNNQADNLNTGILPRIEIRYRAP